MEGVARHKIAHDCPCDECDGDRKALIALKTEHARQQMAGVHLAKEIMDIPESEWGHYRFHLRRLAHNLLTPQ